MDKPLLDEQCKRLLSLLLASEKTLRFTELHETINGVGLKMSRPTLIEHLHHLQKHRLIVRKKEGKQNVSYRVNWEKLETLKKGIEYRRYLLHVLENKKRFKSFPIDEQVVYVAEILALTGLYRLKLEVQDTLDPSKNFEHSLQVLLINRFFEFFKTWLRESCINSPENGQTALSKIESSINSLQDDLFDRIPKPS
jgi:DNA-binding HxlR family transcriptional regulator